MCKDQSLPRAQEAFEGPSWHIEKNSSVWQFKVAVSERPELEINSAALRLIFTPDAASLTVPIPLHAQPVDPEVARCKFSKRRGELIVEWPCDTKVDAASIEASVDAKIVGAPGAISKTPTETVAMDEAVTDRVAAENAAAVKVTARGAEAEEASAEKAGADKDAAEEVAVDSTAKAVSDTDVVMRATALEQVAEKPVAQDAAAGEVGAKQIVPEQADAMQASEDSHAKHEDDADALVTAEEWRARGNAAVKSGDHETAIVCYSSGIDKVSTDSESEALLRSNRALCLHKLERYQEAADDAKRCVDLKPDFVKGYLRGAMSLRALGCPGEALAMLKRAPVNDEACALAAEIRPEAEAAEKARIEALPQADRAKEEGNVLFRKGLFEDAIHKYSCALELCEDPEGSLALSIRNNRAACYHQLSDFGAVIRDTNYVLEHEPSNIKALVRRMLALEPLERYEQSLKDARSVLLQDPRNEMANKVQHRLSKLVRDLSRTSSNA